MAASFGYVGVLPRPPRVASGCPATVGGPVVVWQLANAAPAADIPPAGSSVGSSGPDGKRDSTPCADRFEAVTVWRSFWMVDYAGLVPWECSSRVDPLREVLPNFPEHSSIQGQIKSETSIITSGGREKETKKKTNEICLGKGSRRAVPHPK